VERELPIIGRIAAGSLKNKLLFLLLGALLLGFLAPRAITPLLMLGGAYLCYEGAEKVHEVRWPHAAHGHAAAAAAGLDAQQLEDQKVGSAIKTDLILSAEIMAITLATVATASFWTQAVVLAAAGIGITAIVYGVVALIVKADDAGVAR
jgi:predicted DNA repair protein MutK